MYGVLYTNDKTKVAASEKEGQSAISRLFYARLGSNFGKMSAWLASCHSMKFSGVLLKKLRQVWKTEVTASEKDGWSAISPYLGRFKPYLAHQ